MGKIDEVAGLLTRLAGDAPPVAGYLTYNPGPGIYSRMERAVEALPENVRVQELPGLLKRYKDGIPGWELKAVDLDSLTAGRDVVPRQEILAAVKERSPVYTHREVVLGGRPQQEEVVRYQARGPDEEGFGLAPRPAGKAAVYQPEPSPLGRGVSHGEAAFERFGQGGENYGELVVLSPEARRSGWGQNVHHFHKDYPSMHGRMMSPEVRSGLTNEGVAHARFDEHDGALRVNEVQSDLGISNRKAREAEAHQPQQQPYESDGDYAARLDQAGWRTEWTTDGELEVLGPKQPIHFPLEDASMELLTKRLALYAAQNNLRRIEIASPQSIADSLNMDPDRARHVYDKLLPSHWERLGRKMGGLAQAPSRRGPEPVAGSPYQVAPAHHRAQDAFVDLQVTADQYMDPMSGQVSTFGILDDMVEAMRFGEDATPIAERLRRHMLTHAIENGWPRQAAEIAVNRDMPNLMRKAENWVHLRNQKDAIANLARETEPALAPPSAPGRAYEMSEEMFRRILQQGIPASVLAPLLMQQDDSP